MSRRGENIYKRKDGRYEGRYVIGKTEDGRTKFGYVYGRYYQSVRDELTKKRALFVCRTESGPHSRTTLSTCMRRWFEELHGSVRPSSYQTYLRSYQKYIEPELGGIAAARLNAATLQAFAASLRASGLAASTVRSICRLLTACLRYAQEEGLIAKNPCRHIQFEQPSAPVHRVLDEREQGSLANAALAGRDLPVLISVYTGLRLGEICALKWEDIDWKNGTLRVQRTAQRVCRLGGGTYLTVGI